MRYFWGRHVKHVPITFYADVNDAASLQLGTQSGGHGGRVVPAPPRFAPPYALMRPVSRR